MRVQLCDDHRNFIGGHAIVRQARFDAEPSEKFPRFLNRQVNLFLVAAAFNLPDPLGVLQQFGALLRASDLHDRRRDNCGGTEKKGGQKITL